MAFSTRRPGHALRLLALMLLAQIAPGPAHAQDDDTEGLQLSGYAEAVYSHYDYGPDQKSGPNGSPPGDRATIDMARFVLEVGYRFSPSLTLEAEIELEHGGTGSALELEYEEFGEYEVEAAKGGEVVLEEMHLTKRFSRSLNVRGGRILVPVGTNTRCHTPTCYFGTLRSESEGSLIPMTWHESGIEVFGRWKMLSYSGQLTSGLDSSGFSSKYWVRDGHQTRFELVTATDLATTLRLDLRPVSALRIGGAVYTGDTSGNRPKPDMEGIPARLTLASSDFQWSAGPMIVRGSALFGWLQNADQITSKNSRLSTNLGVSRTPVAKEAREWSIEAGVDVLPWIHPSTASALFPFVRYETYNSMQAVDDAIYADPRFDRKVATFGIDWYVTPTVVLKSDYSIRSFGADRYRDEKTFSLGFGALFG